MQLGSSTSTHLNGNFSTRQNLNHQHHHRDHSTNTIMINGLIMFMMIIVSIMVIPDQADQVSKLGRLIFPRASLFNSSCIPSCVRYLLFHRFIITTNIANRNITNIKILLQYLFNCRSISNESIANITDSNITNNIC